MLESDLTDLKAERAYQLNSIDRFSKFKSRLDGLDDSFKKTVELLSRQITDLERQLAENHKLVDLILIEVKAIFVGALAKLETTPT